MAALMNPDSSDEMVDHLIDFFDQIAPVYDSWANGQHSRVAAGSSSWSSRRRGSMRSTSAQAQVWSRISWRRKSALVRDGYRPVGPDAVYRPLEGQQEHAVSGHGRRTPRVQAGDVRPGDDGEALAYFADPDDALNEAYRVLREGGRVAVSCQRRSLSTRAQDLFFQGLAPLARRHYLNFPRYSSERSRFGERMCCRACSSQPASKSSC